MASDTAVFLSVRIEEHADLSQQVWRVDVEDIDRGCDMVTLRMDDPNSANSDAIREGQKVQIELGWETEMAFIFEGLIRSVRAVAGGTSHLEVQAFDMSSKLAQPLPDDASTRHSGTLESIIRKLAGRHSIEVGAVTIDPMPTIPDTSPGVILQGSRTDWQIMQELAEQYRARVFVEINVTPGDVESVRRQGGKPRLYFISEQALLAQKAMGRLQYCRGASQLLEFDYSRVADGAWPSTSTTVSHPDTGEPVAQAGPAPATDPAPSPSAARSSEIQAVSGDGAARAYEASNQVGADAAVRPADLRTRREASGLPSDPDLARQAIAQDRTRVLGYVGRGLAMGTVMLRAKGAVEIEGLSTWAEGRWYVARVNHIVERQRLHDRTQLTYRSRFVATR